MNIDTRRFEEIHYDLSYHGESLDIHRQIIETILRLPEKVAGFAVENCRFISVGEAIYGITLPGRIATNLRRTTRNVWIIVLSENCNEKDIHSIIAHEIAHAWRKDDRLANTPEDCENQTANLVRDWGFTGCGANADYCSAFGYSQNGER
jgi:hypothetical protein